MELIKLKTKEGTTTTDSDRIEQTFINACLELNVSLFEPMVAENTYFEDKDKYRFLQSLKELFENVEGQTLSLKYGTCGLCRRGCKTYGFHSSEKVHGYTINRIEFAYMIEKKDGHITDIYKCNDSSGYNNRQLYI